MSELLLPVIVAASIANAGPPPPPPPPPKLNDISISLPALDGLRGLHVQYERFVRRHRLGLAVSGQFRETATGDYTSLRTGVGAEVRWYWRGDAWLSRQPKGSMAGWFVGGRLDALVERTHDDIDDRGIGTTLQLGVAARVGYRIAPWRDLEITPSFSITEKVDIASRAPTWTRPGIGWGLSLGWLF